jgi:hypothetical protein
MGERYAATMGRIDEQATEDRQATPFRDADDDAPWFEATIPDGGKPPIRLAASAPKEES